MLGFQKCEAVNSRLFVNADLETPYSEYSRLYLDLVNAHVIDFSGKIQWWKKQTGQTPFIGVKWPFSKGRGR